MQEPTGARERRATNSSRPSSEPPSSQDAGSPSVNPAVLHLQHTSITTRRCPNSWKPGIPDVRKSERPAAGIPDVRTSSNRTTQHPAVRKLQRSDTDPETPAQESPPPAGHWSPSAGHWRPALGLRPLVTGLRPLVSDHWPHQGDITPGAYAAPKRPWGSFLDPRTAPAVLNPTAQPPGGP